MVPMFSAEALTTLQTWLKIFIDLLVGLCE